MSNITTLPEDCLLQIAIKCHRDTKSKMSILHLRLVSGSLATVLNRFSTYTVGTLLSEDFRPALSVAARTGGGVHAVHTTATPPACCGDQRDLQGD